MRIPPSFRKLSSKGQFTTPRFSLKNFTIALLVNAGLVHMSLYGSVPLTTFEPPISSGSNLSSVSSDWTVANGEAKVLSGVGYQGTQGVQLTKASNDEAHISRAISWNTSEQTAFIDLRIKPAANHQGSNAAIVVNGTQIGIQKNSADDSKGDIWVLNGKDSKWISSPPYLDAGLNSPQWFLTYGEFPLNSAKTTASDYMRITLRQDYERKVWDLYIDGKLTAADLRFEQRGILDALHIYGSTVDDVMLDELQALPSNMLFTDSDKDGIPDSVELANGSNPNLKDRELIDPVTGKTYLQKYLEQLWPNNTPAGTGTYVASPGTIPPLTLPVHTPVGALKGNFSVGGDGSATYSIPIDLPKGTSGMEPQLSLSYSSNGGNGICGLGFGLSGLQSITRGPSSLKKDGFIDGVNFDEKDRFFLNGERLVCVAGTYGANGSEYRTEIDSYARITLSGNANSGHASYWTVQTKAGLTLQFGNTIDSRVSCSGANAPYAWSVNQVTDASGNYYKLIYGLGSMSPYPSNAPIYAGSTIPDHRIAKIVYTGNEAASLTPYCSVDFIYENRTDTSFSYNYGIKFESTKRLKEIEVKTNSYQNHKYNLTYATSRQTGRSLLASVQKFVGTQAIPKTTINWDAFTSNDTVPLASDYTDPLAASSMWIKKSNWGTNTPQFYDYEGSQNNQDGIISFVSLEENDTVLHLTGNAWRAKAISYSVTPATLLQFDYKVPATPTPEVVAIGIDTNLSADSSHVFQLQGTQTAHNQTYKAGSIYNIGSAGQWVTVTIPIGTHFTGNAQHLALINDDDDDQNGVGECYFRNIRLYEPGQSGLIPFASGIWEVPELTSSSWVDRGFNFIDINADGLVDIVRNSVVGGTDLSITAGVSQTLLNQGDGWSAEDQTWNLPADAFISSNDGDDTDSAFNYVRGASTFSDFDGDGRVDIMVRNFFDGTQSGGWPSSKTPAVTFSSRVNNGNGWSNSSAYSYPFSTIKESNHGASTNNRFRDWIETDLNGDGFTDLIANTYRGLLEAFPSTSPYNTDPNSFLTLLYTPTPQNNNYWLITDQYRIPDPANPATEGYISEGIGKDDLGRGLLDLNGDGLPEFYAANPSVTKTFRNTGTGWEWSNASPPVCSDVPAMRLPFPIVSSGGSSRGCRMVDLNGDGLPDFLRGFSTSTGAHAAPGSQLSIHINNGNYANSTPGSMFTPMTNGVNQNWITPYTLDWDGTGVDNFGNELADINGDGLTDLIFASTYVNKAYANTGTNFSENSAYAFPAGVRFCSTESQLDNKRRNARLVDVNGDGFPDLLANLNGTAPEVWINQSKSEKIKQITDGFGSDIQIEYTRLNDPTVKPAFNSRVYQKNFGTLPTGHIGVIDSRFVVSRYSAPTYVSSNDESKQRRFTSHRYGDLRYDRNNEMSLGFAWAEVKDELTQQITRTEYRQDFPFAGSPSVTDTKVIITETDINTAQAAGSNIFEGTTAGWKCLTKETAAYDQKVVQNGIAGGKIYRPVQISAVKEQFDLNCNLKSRTITNQPLAEYDEYGFLKNSTVTSLDGTVIATSSIYNHNVEELNAPNPRWHLGRLASSSVSKVKSGLTTITKSSTFSYYPNGLLWTETVEPGNALSVTKTYSYDAYGNITGTAVTGVNTAAIAETRSSGTAYDSKGRFVIAETNQLAHSVFYQYDQDRAQLKSTTDINGLVTKFTYDDFGSLILTQHPDGTQTGEHTGIVNGNVLPPYVAAANIIKYYRAKQTSGGPVAYAYFDAAGREILNRSTTLINATASGAARYATIYSHNKFDEFGRNTHTSLPFASDETPMYTERLIDVLSRTYCTKHPNGSVDKVDCYGVATLNGQPVTYSCVSAANGQTLERWEDQHGRLVKSKDESGMETVFNHDLEGRLVNVSVGGELLLQNTFDIFGNKTSVWEKNSDTSSSTYSAFGEVATSTNARDEVTKYTYDLLGRPLIIERPLSEGTFINEYDTAGGTAAKGKPSKITGPDNYLETIVYDSLGRPTSTSKKQFGADTYYTFTSYDVLGRVSHTTDAGGLTTCTHYDQLYSFPVKIVLASPPNMNALPGVGTVLWEAKTFDPRGNALTQTLGNGVTITQQVEATTGNLNLLQATHASTTVQNKDYDWDSAGNLIKRTNFAVNGNATTLIENFGYDHLNRLTSRTIGSNVENYTYDTKGNLLSKPGAALAYANGKPHQVSTATVKGVTRNYTYNTAGYVTNDGKRDYFWSSFGQLKELIYTAAPPLHDLSGTQLEPAALVHSQFFFDAAGNRARQWKTRTSTGSYRTEETLYLGSYEREIHSSSAHPSITPTLYKTVHRHSLGDMVYTRTITPSTGEIVRLTTKLDDHLGSTDVLITSKWQNNTFVHESTEYQAYDPWGERAATSTAVAFRQTDSDPFRRSAQDYDRGYTGHEQLDDSGIIHMNGRLYDAELGRMLSADPYVQVPEYSQNFNRYSYVLNNPLNKTDPTGYSWLSKAFHKIGAWLKENWRSVVAIVLGALLFFTGIGGAIFAALYSSVTGASIVGMSMSAFYAGMGAVTGSIMGAVNAALAGGDLGDVLRGAVVGGVSGAITGGLAETSSVIQMAGKAVVGGASNAAMGGKFQDGFISSTINSVADKVGLMNNGNIVSKTVRSAIVSGSASEIGGGKFSNGAVTGAFQYLMYNGYNQKYDVRGIDGKSNPAFHFAKSIFAGANILGDLSESMRLDQVAQSKLDGKNSGGKSAGYKDDGFKLGGSRFNPFTGQFAKSPLGGSQNGKGFIGFGLDFNYEPGTFWDLLVETYAGPHDYVSKWSYDESTGNANSPPNMLIKVASGLNVLTATPFAVATLIAPTSRDLESFWPSNNK